MVYKILWYQENKSILIDVIGKYNNNDLVQAYYEVTNQYLEKISQRVDIIFDLRSIDIDFNQTKIIIEPIENILLHPKSHRIFLLGKPKMKTFFKEIGDDSIEIYFAQYLQEIDEMI